MLRSQFRSSWHKVSQFCVVIFLKGNCFCSLQRKHSNFSLLILKRIHFSLPRRPGRRKKRRRSTTTTTTTERNVGVRSEPDLKNFCRQVLRTMANSLEQDSFNQVSMYQEIWYLVSKYNIQVPNHNTDIVIVVEQLCQDNHNQVSRYQKPFDNSVEIDTETNAFVFHSPAPSEENHRFDPGFANTFVSSTTPRTLKLTTRRRRLRPRPKLGDPFPPDYGHAKHAQYLESPHHLSETLSLPKKENIHQLTRSQYPRVRIHGAKGAKQQSDNEIFSGSLGSSGDKSTGDERELMTSSVQPITAHPALITHPNHAAPAAYSDNGPQVRWSWDD